MALDFELNELIPTLEELLLIRQACIEAQENAVYGGIVAGDWQEEADRLAELLEFLEATPTPPVPPKLAEWAVRLSVRAGQLSDYDSRFVADAVETDAPEVAPLLAASEQSGGAASALASAAIYVQGVLMQQAGGEERG